MSRYALTPLITLLAVALLLATYSMADTLIATPETVVPGASVTAVYTNAELPIGSCNNANLALELSPLNQQCTTNVIGLTAAVGFCDLSSSNQNPATGLSYPPGPCLLYPKFGTTSPCVATAYTNHTLYQGAYNICAFYQSSSIWFPSSSVEVNVTNTNSMGVSSGMATSFSGATVSLSGCSGTCYTEFAAANAPGGCVSPIGASGNPPSAQLPTCAAANPALPCILSGGALPSMPDGKYMVCGYGYASQTPSPSWASYASTSFASASYTCSGGTCTHGPNVADPSASGSVIPPISFSFISFNTSAVLAGNTAAANFVTYGTIPPPSGSSYSPLYIYVANYIQSSAGPSANYQTLCSPYVNNILNNGDSSCSGSNPPSTWPGCYAQYQITNNGDGTYTCAPTGSYQTSESSAPASYQDTCSCEVSPYPNNGGVLECAANSLFPSYVQQPGGNYGLPANDFIYCGVFQAPGSQPFFASAGLLKEIPIPIPAAAPAGSGSNTAPFLSAVCYIYGQVNSLLLLLTIVLLLLGAVLYEGAQVLPASERGPVHGYAVGMLLAGVVGAVVSSSTMWVISLATNTPVSSLLSVCVPAPGLNTMTSSSTTSTTTTSSTTTSTSTSTTTIEVQFLISGAPLPPLNLPGPGGRTASVQVSQTAVSHGTGGFGTYSTDSTYDEVNGGTGGPAFDVVPGGTQVFFQWANPLITTAPSANYIYGGYSTTSDCHPGPNQPSGPGQSVIVGQSSGPSTSCTVVASYAGCTNYLLSGIVGLTTDIVATCNILVAPGATVYTNGYDLLAGNVVDIEGTLIAGNDSTEPGVGAGGSYATAAPYVPGGKYGYGSNAHGTSTWDCGSCPSDSSGTSGDWNNNPAQSGGSPQIPDSSFFAISDFGGAGGAGGGGAAMDGDGTGWGTSGAGGGGGARPSGVVDGSQSGGTSTSWWSGYCTCVGPKNGCNPGAPSGSSGASGYGGNGGGTGGQQTWCGFGGGAASYSSGSGGNGGGPICPATTSSTGGCGVPGGVTNIQGMISAYYADGTLRARMQGAGGGGGGDAAIDGAAPHGSTGGNASYGIYIQGDKVYVNGHIYANGQDGQKDFDSSGQCQAQNSGAAAGGGGGGGGGGAIIIAYGTIIGGGGISNAQSNGGLGTQGKDCQDSNSDGNDAISGNGGNGGGGYLYSFQYTTPPVPT